MTCYIYYSRLYCDRNLRALLCSWLAEDPRSFQNPHRPRCVAVWCVASQLEVIIFKNPITTCSAQATMSNLYPVTNITTPHPHDVLCGRGGYINNHEGNKNWRRLVAANKELYVALPKYQKQLLSQSIVHAVRSQNPPGRFLLKNSSGLWNEIGEQKAYDKTSQALREDGPAIRVTVESKGISPDSVDLLKPETIPTVAQLCMNPQQEPPTIQIYMPSPDDAAKISTAANATNEQNEATHVQEASAVAYTDYPQYYPINVPSQNPQHRYPTNVPSSQNHVVSQLEAAASSLLASSQASAQTRANIEQAYHYPDIHPSNDAAAVSARTDRQTRSHENASSSSSSSNQSASSPNAARAPCAATAAAPELLEPYTTTYDAKLLDKPAISFGSMMSCSMAPPALQTIDASFGTLSLDDAGSKTTHRIQTSNSNTPTLLSHHRSTADLLASDSGDDGDDGNLPANWEKMRAVFGMTHVPHDIGHAGDMDLLRDISGMSAFSFGDVALERSPSSTIMRDVGDENPRGSTLVSDNSELSTRDDELSEQEKLEKLFLDRGRSLVFEKFGRKWESQGGAGSVGHHSNDE